MRTRTIILALVILLAGAMGGAMLAPPPADAVSRQIIEIQQTVGQILQNQQDIRSDIDSKFASMQTLVQQSLNSANSMSQTMGALQKTVQDAQANNGANSSSTTQQMQGISDNMQDLQARLAKLAQQMTDMQSTLQTINAKVSTNSPTPLSGVASDAGPGTAANQPAPAPTAAQSPANLQPISGDTLYSNAVRDLNTSNYALSRQEFSDYLANFPDGPFAANAQFYTGEIAYAQGKYTTAIGAYDKVIVNYPRSSKVAPAMLEKGRALAQTNKRISAMREFRELIRRFPGSDEAKKAEPELRRLSR